MKAELNATYVGKEKDLVNSDLVATDIVILFGHMVKFVVEQFEIVATSTTGIFQLMPIVVL